MLWDRGTVHVVRYSWNGMECTVHIAIGYWRLIQGIVEVSLKSGGFRFWKSWNPQYGENMKYIHDYVIEELD